MNDFDAINRKYFCNYSNGRRVEYDGELYIVVGIHRGMLKLKPDKKKQQITVHPASPKITRVY